MDLKNSSACRLSSDNLRPLRLTIGKDRDIRSGKPFITLAFDLGTENKQELAMVMLSSADFSQLASAMMKVDRDGTTKAFAEALLET